MMILMILAAEAQLPALPSMPARVYSTYLEYDWCISDAAKALFKDRNATSALFDRAKQACSEKRMYIELALDADVASKTADKPMEDELNSAGSVDEQIKANNAILGAIDARTAMMFPAYLRNYRSEAN